MPTDFNEERAHFAADNGPLGQCEPEEPEPFNVITIDQAHAYTTYKRIRTRHPEIATADLEWLLGVRKARQLEQMFLDECEFRADEAKAEQEP